jgi:hypothetical protein
MKILLAIATSMALLVPATAHGLGFCGSCGATPSSQCGYADTLWSGYCNEPIGCGGSSGCATGSCAGGTAGAGPSWWYGYGGCCGAGGSGGCGRSSFGFSGLGHTGFGGWGRRGGLSACAAPAATMASCGCSDPVAVGCDDCGCGDTGWSAPAAPYGFGQRHRCAAPACGCGQSRMGLRQLFSRLGGGRSCGTSCDICSDCPSASYAPGQFCGSGTGCGVQGSCGEGMTYSNEEQTPHPADPQTNGMTENHGVPGVMETPVDEAAPIHESPMYEDGMPEGPIHEIQPSHEAAPTEAGEAINPTNADGYTPAEKDALPEGGNKEAKRRPTPSRRWNIQG